MPGWSEPPWLTPVARRARGVPWWRRPVVIPLWLLILLLVVGTFEWLSAVFLR